VTLLDTRQRPLRDLRISVTDRCNFRCTYCMPKEVFGFDFPFMPRAELLSYEEIRRLASLFAVAGVQKIRLTGGEPLLRKNIEGLVGMLSSIDGIEDLTLTTNASLLVRKAGALKAAGLKRITVSLDALDDDTFGRLNDVNFPVQRVLDGIDAAAAVGLAPIKINTVVKRSVNEDAVLQMAEHFRGTGHIVRYIEFMDVGHTNGWQMDEVMTAAEIVERIDAVWPLEPAEPNYVGEVAGRYRYKDGAGEIGVIASVTQPFCGACTRARLSADGKLYTCLFGIQGHDFRGPLRDGASDEELAALIERVWTRRTDRYSELRSVKTVDLPKVEMSYIGG
jgi:cyclic pyranopterin phosphate synthase